MLIPGRIKVITLTFFLRALLLQALGVIHVLADEPSSLTGNKQEPSLFMPQRGASLFMPQRGQSPDQVASEFGDPQRATGIEGKSSIRTWHYEYFSVYFREEQVVHSVRRHRDLLTIAAD